MAVLVIGLSCIPCADDVFASNPDKAKKEISTEHEHQENHNDACSPFCHCTCCAGYSINHSLISISNPLISGDKFFSSYLPDNLIEVSLPIWQPPQLV